MKASYLMLKMPFLCRQYSSYEVLLFLTLCLSTVSNDTSWMMNYSLFHWGQKNQGKFLSPNIQFSPIMQRIWEMRNKARKKTRKAFFKYWLYCVSRTASCALSEIISKMKREDNPLLKSEVPEAPSTPLEIHFMQQNLWNKLVLCILS